MADEQVVEQQPTQEQVAADSSAGFEAGFNGARGIEAPPVEKPVEAKAEETKVEVPAEEATPDEWEGVPPKVKAELESMRGQLAKVPDRLRNIEGHIGGLTSQLKTAVAAKAAVEKTGAEAPTSTQIEQAKSSAKWEQLKADYPDWAEAMDERLATLKPSQAQVDVAGLRTEVTKDIAPLIAEARQFAQVDVKYPDWEDTVKTPEFSAWHAKQAPEMQALAASPKGRDAIKLLDAYAEAQKAAIKAAEVEARKKAEQEAKNKRLQGATTPQGAASASPHTLNDADALERGFSKVRGG